MSETSRATLLHLLLTGYEDLKKSLTRRLGSPDLAADALQDTYLRLEGAGDIGPVASPRSYLYRIALNIAADHRRAESRRLAVSEVEVLLEIADDAPNPAQIAEARSETEAVMRALTELPVRRRAIFIAAWVEGASRRAMAERFGISERRIKIELKLAREHCALRLDRNMLNRFPSGPR